MTKLAKIAFSKLDAPKGGVVVLLAAEDLSLGKISGDVVSGLEGGLARAAGIAGFSGKKKSSLDLVAPAGLALDRLIVFGIGKAADIAAGDWRSFGGAVFAALQKAKAQDATVLLEAPDGVELSSEGVAEFAMAGCLAEQSRRCKHKGAFDFQEHVSVAKLHCQRVARGPVAGEL